MNFEYRMHDPRLGRFFAIDPLASQYSYNSVYVFSENRVIDCIELEGLEVYFDEVGNFLGMLGDESHREIRVVTAENVEEAKKYIKWAQDQSANGVKHQKYNIRQLRKLSDSYEDVDESIQIRIAKSIFQIWIKPKVAIQSMVVTHDFNKVAGTIGAGKFVINPNAAYGVGSESVSIMSNLYDQVNTWYHENLHSEYESEGITNSDTPFYHFLIGQKQFDHWSFKYTTEGFKKNWEDFMYGFINDQREIIKNLNDKLTKKAAIENFNNNVKWLNTNTNGKIELYSED